MCSTCGCGEGEVRINDVPLHDHEHTHEHTHEHDHGGHHHSHPHAHAHKHPHHHEHHCGCGHHHDHEHKHHVHGHHHDHHDHSHSRETPRMVEIERNLLERNDAIAKKNRQLFQDRALFVLNLVSSPGSGKTSLLVKTIEVLKNDWPCAVIEGDQQTQNDAERIRTTGIPSVQINTGKGCHLDARMVRKAMDNLPSLSQGMLFIENVGNLVCPAAFDLGEAHKVAILSVTEGTDKPQKYPDMFHEADMMLINKIDLLPYVDFDVDQAIAYARQVNPKIEVMRVSATTGEGMAAWHNWLIAGTKQVSLARDNDIDLLRKRVAELEALLGQ